MTTGCIVSVVTTPLKTVIYTAVCVVVILGSPFKQSFSISPQQYKIKTLPFWKVVGI
jgi:hypothetical protein